MILYKLILRDVTCSSNVYPSSALEQQFGTIRRSLQSVMLQWQIISDTVTSKINTGLDHSQCKEIYQFIKRIYSLFKNIIA